MTGAVSGSNARGAGSAAGRPVAPRRPDVDDLTSERVASVVDGRGTRSVDHSHPFHAAGGAARRPVGALQPRRGFRSQQRRRCLRRRHVTGVRCRVVSVLLQRIAFLFIYLFIIIIYSLTSIVYLFIILYSFMISFIIIYSSIYCYCYYNIIIIIINTINIIYLRI